MRAVGHRRGQAFPYTTTRYPPARGGRTCSSGFDTVDVVNSNIVVLLLEEAKSQAQPERGSCEPWSRHIARLLHETKLLFEPTIVVLPASIAL